MKVTLLGTASAEGMPGLFCSCETCKRVRRAGGKNIRTRSSALIDNTLKIDFPPDTLTQVVRNDLDMSAIQALLFTHGHDDHFSPAELQYRGRYFVEPAIMQPLHIYGPSDVVDRVACVLNQELMAFSVTALAPETAIRIAGFDVFPFAANHDPSVSCLNYVLTASDGVSLLYASDTGWYDDRTWRLLEQFNLDGIVVECTKREEGGYAGHLSVPEVARLRRRLIDAGSLRPDAPVLATHFGHQMALLHDELESALAPHGIVPAYDGLTMDIVSSAHPETDLIRNGYNLVCGVERGVVM